MRIGQTNIFLRFSDPAGKIFWIGIFTAQVFSPRSRGVFSNFVVDEDPRVKMGSKAYEIVVKQPLKEDYTTDRTEVRPTRRVVGEVVDVLDDGVSVIVRFEEWFVESEVFKIGTWREIAERLEVGDEVYMEVIEPA